MRIGLSEYLKSNGQFAYMGGGVFRSIDEKRKAYRRDDDPAIHALLSLSSTNRGKELAMSMMQQGSAYLYAVNQMLMQSQRNVIRIFPAVMKCAGDCAFDSLRAEGAFLVSGRMKGGKTSQVSVESIAGKGCTLRIYDVPDKPVLKLRDSKGKIIEAARIDKNTWRFPTRKGMKYYWSRSGKAKPIELKPGKVSGVKEFTDYRGNTITYGKRGHLYEK